MTAPEAFEKSLPGLSLRSVRLATVVNNEFVVMPTADTPIPAAAPVARGKAATAKRAVLAPVAATPGGKALVASTDALGKKGVSIRVAQSDDGTSRSSLDLQEDGFTFDLLFTDFASSSNQDFVFDQVKVVLKADQEKSRLIFSGILRMRSALLRPLQKFIRQDEGLLVGGTLDVSNQDLAQKLRPSGMILTSAASFHVALGDDVVFSDLQLGVEIKPAKSSPGAATAWSVLPSLEGKVALANLGHQAVDCRCRIEYAGKALKVSAQAARVDGLFGISTLSLKELKADFAVGGEKSIRLQAKLDAAGKTYALGGVLNRKYSALYAEIGDFSLTDLQALYQEVTSLSLALPDFAVTLSEVHLAMATAKCKLGEQALAEGVTLGASLQAHGHQCQALAQISSSGMAFTGDLGELTIGPLTVKKARLQMQFFTAASGRASQFAVVGQAVIEGLELDCRLAYEKGADGWTAIVYAAIHAESFAFSAIIPAARKTFVDSLTFSKAAFIYASHDGRTEDPDFSFAVRKGLQLMCVLHEIPALSDLTGNRQVGLELSAYYGKGVDIGIALPDTRLQLGNSVACNPFQVRIVISPKPSFNLIFGLDVSVPRQDEVLHFDAQLAVGIEGASGSGTMKAYWQNPFGVQGLRIGPALALELGILYPVFLTTGTPSDFGFAGGLVLGDVTANMAVKISEDPSEEILYGELQELSPANLVSFAEQVSKLKLPADAVPNFFTLHELKIYCAPAGGSIGTISFERGFSFACDLVLFGRKAAAYTRLSDDGVVAKAHLDRLTIGPLKISGEAGRNAILDLQLTTARQSLLVDGAIDFLGASAAVIADISNRGIEFHFRQSFLGLLSYQIDGVSEGSIGEPATLDFLLAGEFDNQLTAYLKDDLARKLHAATSVVETDLKAATRDVDRAERIYKAEFDKAKKALERAQADASRLLEQCQQAVASEGEKYARALKQAKRDVAKARQAFDKALANAEKALRKAQTDYDGGMRSAQAALSKAQHDYDAAMINARNEVSRAQKAYSNAMGGAASKVRTAREAVGSLARERDAAVHELKHLSWTKSYKAPYLAAKIAGLETAMRAAQGVLYAAEGVLTGVQKGVEFGAFEAAKAALEGVRFGGEYGALEVAKKGVEAARIGGRYGVLEAARRSVAAAQTGADFSAWQLAKQTLSAVEIGGRLALDAAEQSLAGVGQSSVYLALEAASHSLELVKQGSSALAFESAKAGLEGVRQGSAAMLRVSEYAAAHAGGLIDVRRVTLSARLKAIERGELFKADVELAIFSTPLRWTVDFDVRKPLAFVDTLLRNTLSDAKRLLT
jgi:hypothetical protein